jgi:hypothetical protein
LVLALCLAVIKKLWKATPIFESIAAKLTGNLV